MGLIGLVEIQINPKLLARCKHVKENLFRSDINNTILTNNENELMDVIHQGGVLSSVRGKLALFARVSGVDKNMLCRWTWIELFSHDRKIQPIAAYNCTGFRSSGYHNTVYSQQSRYFLK